MFCGVRLDPTKVRGDPCRDPSVMRRVWGLPLGGSNGIPLDIGVLTVESAADLDE
jgi:hypothetical protein